MKRFHAPSWIERSERCNKSPGRPVLAASAAYAVSDVFGWRQGLSRGFHEARGFYTLIIVTTVVGTIMSTFEVDPIKALVWSAIVNGVIAVPTWSS